MQTPEDRLPGERETLVKLQGKLADLLKLIQKFDNERAAIQAEVNADAIDAEIQDRSPNAGLAKKLAGANEKYEQAAARRKTLEAAIAAQNSTIEQIHDEITARRHEVFLEEVRKPADRLRVAIAEVTAAAREVNDIMDRHGETQLNEVLKWPLISGDSFAKFEERTAERELFNRAAWLGYREAPRQ